MHWSWLSKISGGLFHCVDNFHAAGVRSKSQKLESTISDWNQYWMQIESRFFAPFTSPSTSHSLILFLPSMCAHDVRVSAIHSVSPFSALPATLPFCLYLSRRIAEGRASLTVSIKKKWLTVVIDNERHFSVSSLLIAKILCVWSLMYDEARVFSCKSNRIQILSLGLRHGII